MHASEAALGIQTANFILPARADRQLERQFSRVEKSMSKRDVLVLGAARSAIGSFGGALSEIEPADLAGTVMKEAVKRSGVDPKAINYVTVGNTIPDRKSVV